MNAYLLNISEIKTIAGTKFIEESSQFSNSTLYNIVANHDLVLFVLINKTVTPKNNQDLMSFHVKYPNVAIVMVVPDDAFSSLDLNATNIVWNTLILTEEFKQLMCFIEKHGENVVPRASHSTVIQGKSLEEEKYNRLPEKIKKAITFIMSHVEEEINPEKLANVCNMSLSTLYREFHRNLGVSVCCYIRQYKLNCAYEEVLNEPIKPIADIANRYCFSDTSHFIKHFKRRYGMTPGSIRKLKVMDHQTKQLG